MYGAILGDIIGSPYEFDMWNGSFRLVCIDKVYLKRRICC